jgi:hypothetical protein
VFLLKGSAELGRREYKYIPPSICETLIVICPHSNLRSPHQIGPNRIGGSPR